MTIQKIDEHFSQSPQILAEDMKSISEAGFKGIVCARPDNEDSGQPSFKDIAEAASRFDLKAFHIPISGRATEDQIDQFRQAISNTAGPVLGYCRSGARAGNLYSASR